MRTTKWPPIRTTAFCLIALAVVCPFARGVDVAARRIANGPPRRERERWLVEQLDNSDDELYSGSQPRPVYHNSESSPHRYYYHLPHSNQRLRYRARNNLIGPNGLSRPNSLLSFNGGEFHIGRDQFVSFGVSDALIGPRVRPRDPGPFRAPDTVVDFNENGRPGVPGIPAGIVHSVNNEQSPDGQLEQQSLYYDPVRLETTTTTESPPSPQTPPHFVIRAPPPLSDSSMSTTPTPFTPHKTIRTSGFIESHEFVRNASSHRQEEEFDWPKTQLTTSAPPTRVYHYQHNPHLGGGYATGATTPRSSESLTDVYLPADLSDWATPPSTYATPPNEYGSRHGIRPHSQSRGERIGSNVYGGGDINPTVEDGIEGEELNATPTGGSSEVKVERAPPQMNPEVGPGSTSSTSDRNAGGAATRLSTGAIAGIAIGILAPLALVAGAVVFLLFGRRFGSKGGVTNTHHVTHRRHCNVEEERVVRGRNNGCNYIDDSVRVSGFMNSHIELPKESSEEMTSLDNDSFLNSLEAVTIQNYWAETAKNTKV